MTDRSLCMDPLGRPYIAFEEDHLHHAWRDGTTWVLETVDTSPGVGEEASIAIGGGGGIHIAYYDGINDALKYACRDGTGWHVESVDPEGGHHSSVSADKLVRPHIADQAEDLNYAVKTVDGWQIQVVQT